MATLSNQCSIAEIGSACVRRFGMCRIFSNVSLVSTALTLLCIVLSKHQIIYKLQVLVYLH